MGIRRIPEELKVALSDSRFVLYGFANLQLSKTLLSFSLFEKSTRTPNGNICRYLMPEKLVEEN